MPSPEKARIQSAGSSGDGRVRTGTARGRCLTLKKRRRNLTDRVPRSSISPSTVSEAGRSTSAVGSVRSRRRCQSLSSNTIATSWSTASSYRYGVSCATRTAGAAGAALTCAVGLGTLSSFDQVKPMGPTRRVFPPTRAIGRCTTARSRFLRGCIRTTPRVLRLSTSDNADPEMASLAVSGQTLF